MPKPVPETEVNDFLESKLNIQIAPLMKKDIQWSNLPGSFMTKNPAGCTLAPQE
jgi:hypothetical protein